MAGRTYRKLREHLPLEKDHKYLVPTITGLPVVGTPHTDDSEFNHTEDHWHVDSRFVGPDKNTRAVTNKNGERPELMPHMCRNEIPQTMPELTLVQIMVYIQWQDVIEYQCAYCPHRGMPIQGGRCSGHRTNWGKFEPPLYFREKTSGEYWIPTDVVQGNERLVFDFKDQSGTPFAIELIDVQDQVLANITPETIGTAHDTYAATDRLIISREKKENYDVAADSD